MPLPAEPAANVFTTLCERELASIRIQAEQGYADTALKNLDERGGAQELVRQQYTGRYPFELLQNANDAAGKAAARGRVHFLLTDTALIVADNGSGFGEAQIAAICSLGRSSKGPGESVGHKGLGFKSVGEITDHAQIVSALASFQFNGELARAAIGTHLGPLSSSQKLPIYAFPFPVGQSDLGPDAGTIEKLSADGFTTLIRLPLRAGVERSTVEADLRQNIRARLLLFLPHVDHLELRGTTGDFASEISRDSRDGVEHVLLETNEQIEEWYIYRAQVTPDLALLAPLGNAWREVENARFAIAVPVDNDGKPGTEERFPLHVYFPTDERPGLHVAVHAEWILSMDRRQLATTPEATPFNEMLTREVAHQLRSVVAPDLVERTGASARAIEALVPTAESPVGDGGRSLREHWTEALVDAPFLPAVDQTLRRPTDIRLLPRSLPDPAAAHLLADVDRTQTLRPDIERLTAVKTFLVGLSGADEIGLAEFISLLRRPTLDTAFDYYTFLTAWRESAGAPLIAELKKTASVLGAGGQLLTPATDTIFFPRERGENTIPDDLLVPVAHVSDVGDVQKLLRDLGVRPFEWRDLIRDFLIKILSDPAATQDARDRALAGLRAYHQVRLRGNEDLEPVLGRVLLPARTADGSARKLRPAAEIYFGSTWLDSDELEIIYGPFGVAEFLDLQAPQEAEQRQEDIDFYGMLGVQAHPRLDRATPSEPGGYMVNSTRHPHRAGLFSEWFDLPEVSAAAQCPQGHPQTQQLRLSYRLDRHEQLIGAAEPARLMALWNQLARRWGAVFEEGMQAQFYCLHGSHVGDRGRPAPSLFNHTLRSQEWVPVDRGNVPELVRPSEAWIESAQTPRRIQERIPRISDQMYTTHGGAGLASALGLTDAGRPRVADLLLLLESIADEADARGSTSRDIDQAARWVQRTLQDVLRDEHDPHPAPDTVRVLASLNGVTRFVVQPPYADDPLLRDTFEKQRPLLSAEAGLTKLTRYLSMTKLDDAVVTSALPYGEDHGPAFDEISRRINRVKPYLFALVRAENSSAENRVRPALRNLELVVCERLALTYEYDGTQVSREDAVCYIASSPDRRGRRVINIGTAYLEVDRATNEPHWFPLGRQLAQHLNVPTLADGFTMLLTASSDDRDRMMADRQIQPRDIADARRILRLATEDEEELSNVLDSLLPRVSAQHENTHDSASAPDHAYGAPGQTPDSEDATDQDHGTGGSAQIGLLVPAPPPAVDFSSLVITDAVAAAPYESGPLIVNQHFGRGGGGIGRAPRIDTEQENRRIGKRGEEVVYHAERRRLEELGKNPDSVHWVSRVNELSPYDMTSVDEDDQLIYIEVKSTRSPDPTEPFYISHAELIEAMVRRSRFYIYRVTDVDAAVPRTTRWADPLGLIRDGSGRLLLAKAQMALTLER